MFRPHCVYPRSQNVCFPRLHCSGSRLLYRGRALCCVHFPGLSCSGSGCGYSTKMQIGLGLRFVPSLVGATQAARSLMSTLSPGAGCLIVSAVPASVFALVQCAFCLFWKLISVCAPPGRCQQSRISGRLWLETGSLFAVWEGNAVSEAEFDPFTSLLPPASARDGLVRSQLALLWYLLSPSFCERAGSPSHSLSCYLMLAPSDCHQGIQAWSLP